MGGQDQELARGVARVQGRDRRASGGNFLLEPLARVSNQSARINDDLPGLGHRLYLELLAIGLVHHCFHSASRPRRQGSGLSL